MSLLGVARRLLDRADPVAGLDLARAALLLAAGQRRAAHPTAAPAACRAACAPFLVQHPARRSALGLGKLRAVSATAAAASRRDQRVEEEDGLRVELRDFRPEGRGVGNVDSVHRVEVGAVLGGRSVVRVQLAVGLGRPVRLACARPTQPSPRSASGGSWRGRTWRGHGRGEERPIAIGAPDSHGSQAVYRKAVSRCDCNGRWFGRKTTREGNHEDCSVTVPVAAAERSPPWTHHAEPHEGRVISNWRGQLRKLAQQPPAVRGRLGAARGREAGATAEPWAGVVGCVPGDPQDFRWHATVAQHGCGPWGCVGLCHGYWL